jgi:GNAT superfamily N-acetyltransferase
MSPGTESGPEIVRHALIEDAERIGDVHVRSWQEAYAGILPPAFLAGLSVERRVAFWRDAIGHGAVVWVVEVNHVVAGFASVGPARDDDLPPTAAEVHAIYLDPELWDRGLGRVLFAAAVDDLRRGGSEPLVLWVLTGNERGRRFYEAAGWRPDGTRRPIEIGGTSMEEIRYRAG